MSEKVNPEGNEGNEGEQVAPVTPQVPGQPIQTPKGQAQEQPQGEEPAFVTKDELDQVIAQTKREVKMADRQRAKQIKDRVTRLEEQLEAANVQLSPEQKVELENQVIAEFDDDEEPTEPTPGQRNDATDAPPPNVAAAIGMMQAADVIIQEGDPEFEQFIKPHLEKAGPELLLETSKAIAAKQGRLQQQQEKAPLRTPVGGSGGASTTADTLLKGYQEEVKQHRGNPMAVTNCQLMWMKKAEEAGVRLNL